jgi:hypothetical protein
LTRKTCTGIAVSLALLAFAQPSPAGRRTATLKGKISDNQGFPLTGAHGYVTSPSLIGTINFVTTETGNYFFTDLPPGVYKLTVEMPAFKTIRSTGIVLDAGATVMMNFKLEPSELEEEVVTRKPAVGPDSDSVRLASALDKDILTHIPMPRDFSAVLGLVPGAVIESDSLSLLASVLGAPATGNVFSVDGVNVTDPLNRTPITLINVDTIDEVVVETAGLPADRDPGQGAYINVITRSGGNDVRGSLGLYYTGKGLTKSLWSNEQLAGNSLAWPQVDKTNLDTSLTAGGPVLHDFAWFFSNFRFQLKTQNTPFESWTDPIGTTHSGYGWRDSDISGMFKLSTRVNKQFSGMAEVSFSSASEPVYGPDVAWNMPLESTWQLDGQDSLLIRLGMVYVLDPRTLFDLSIGYAAERQPLLLNDAGMTEASYFDSGTDRVWGSGSYNDKERRKRFRGNVTITSFQEQILGANHDLVAGFDYDNAKGSSTVWKADDLVMNYLNGSPYTLGQAVSPTSGNSVGEGIIGFSVIPSDPANPLTTTRKIDQLGVFARDTLTFGGRVTLSLGLRFDHSDTQVMSITEGEVGNPLAVSIGESLIEPVYGINPFNALDFAEWDSVITWNTLSPRFGLSIDLFGTGKTFLRGSYSQLPEDLGLGYTKQLDPVSPDRVYDFYWYDENGDGKPDVGDTYVEFPQNYSIFTSSYTNRIQPDLRAPMTDEWTVGLDHELWPDFKLSVRYISRSQNGGIADVMYDPGSGRSWYTAQGSPSGWWVPFTTTVPATSNSPATNVTVYLPSNTAPAASDRVQFVPELTWKYRGLEFSFQKRMSHNWQFLGSVVWSRSTGTSDLASGLSGGITSPVLTPNSFVNVTPDSRSAMDRPLMVRAMGTVRFKYDIYLSAYCRFMSGSPWARTATIVVPSDWAQEHGVDATPLTVYLESPGSQRYSSVQSTDLRLEKEFIRSDKMRWSVYLDVLNLFGNKYRIIDYNEGYWYPNGEGGSTGTQVLGATYGQAIYVSGTRTFALSLRVGF